MNHFAQSLPSLGPTARVVCAVAASVCAFGVQLGVFELFDQASGERWLSPSPQLLQAKAQCDRLPAREARTRCAQELVARALSAGARTAQAAR